MQDVVRRSEEQYPRLDWYSGATGLGAVQNLWSQLTGDFYQTLQECESLLNRNGHLRNGRTSVAYNLHWWLSAEDAVDNLTAKLRFHITKVEFYTIPSEFDSIVRNGSQIQQLRRQVANLERMMINGAGPSQTLWANFLPNELKAKFDTEFNQNRPLWLAEGSEWPLKEGMEALAFHFARGTVRFEPTSELGNIPGWRPYLNLAKSIWILEQIKQSDHFKAASPESFWAGYMRELEDALRGQLHRFESGELDKPSTQGLLELSDRFYSIDKREEVISDPLDAGKAGPLEEKILEIELPSETSNRNSALLVFRENEADFRLVISTKADALVAQYDLADCVNMDRHRLVPAYSNPARGSSTRNNLLLLNERGRQGREYTFRDPADVRKFQRALTGYRVHHDMPVARWCLNGSQQDGDSGEGMLQLWQFKPLPPMLESTPPEASGAHSLAGSPRSPTVSGTTLLSQTSIMSPVRGPRSGGIEFSKPELPVLIILTRTNQKYTFLHLTRKSPSLPSQIPNPQPLIFSSLLKCLLNLDTPQSTPASTSNRNPAAAANPTCTAPASSSNRKNTFPSAC